MGERSSGLFTSNNYLKMVLLHRLHIAVHTARLCSCYANISPAAWDSRYGHSALLT